MCSRPQQPSHDAVLADSWRWQDGGECVYTESDWQVFSDRIRDFEDYDTCDTRPGTDSCAPTTRDEWERIAKNFEAARRASVAGAEGEWG